MNEQFGGTILRLFTGTPNKYLKIIIFKGKRKVQLRKEHKKG